LIHRDLARQSGPRDGFLEGIHRAIIAPMRTADRET
jgi:hypothetical protein